MARIFPDPEFKGRFATLRAMLAGFAIVAFLFGPLIYFGMRGQL